MKRLLPLLALVLLTADGCSQANDVRDLWRITPKFMLRKPLFEVGCVAAIQLLRLENALENVGWRILNC
jgi:hypothetical protein